MSNGLYPGRGEYWRVWGGIAVVFLCGLLVGIIATDAYQDSRQQKRWEQGLAGLKQRAMQHLTSELHLSTEQRQAIEPTMRQAEGELLRLRMAHQPRVEEILDRTIKDLKTKLSAEQQSALDEVYRKLQRRWDADREYVRGLQPGGRE